MDSVSVYTETESGKANMIIYFKNLFMSHPKVFWGDIWYTCTVPTPTLKSEETCPPILHRSMPMIGGIEMYAVVFELRDQSFSNRFICQWFWPRWLIQQVYIIMLRFWLLMVTIVVKARTTLPKSIHVRQELADWISSNSTFLSLSVVRIITSYPEKASSLMPCTYISNTTSSDP